MDVGITLERETELKRLGENNICSVFVIRFEINVLDLRFLIRIGLEIIKCGETEIIGKKR